MYESKSPGNWKIMTFVARFGIEDRWLNETNYIFFFFCVKVALVFVVNKLTSQRVTKNYRLMNLCGIKPGNYRWSVIKSNWHTIIGFFQQHLELTSITITFGILPKIFKVPKNLSKLYPKKLNRKSIWKNVVSTRFF